MESHVQLADRCSILKYTRSAVCKRCNFKMWVSAENSQAGQTQVITDPISALWRVTLMLALNRSILHRE
jgi:hypothetical protein